ncbi:MAG: T9SS type A sorting domain-containing protein [Candidatus Kapabacteria bacterium]|nr:T9SS type A sorting domain-containing protein [Candidatus Kapabacteria bacterium]
MKKLLLLSLVILLNIITVYAHSGDSINVKYGSTPVIDGIISQGEWDDAAFVKVGSIGGEIYFKHDMTDLYVAFSDDLKYSFSTGIYFDKMHIGGSNLQSGHLWLHGSASQWEWIGSDTSWQKEIPAGWIYKANEANEYKISLSKLGVTGNTNQKMGVLFSFLDWSSGYEITFPEGGINNCTNPESWADITFSFSTGIEEKHNSVDIISSINYYNDMLFIKLNDNLNTGIEILNIHGQIMQSMNFQTTSVEIDVSNLPRGVYFVKIKTGLNTALKSFLLI